MDKPATLTVTKQFRLQAGDTEADPVEEVLEVTNFQTEPAKVRAGFGLTINLGNFESARLDVSVEVPCYKEQLDDAYAQAKKWVEERVQAEVADIKGGGSKGKGLF